MVGASNVWTDGSEINTLESQPYNYYMAVYIALFYFIIYIYTYSQNH